MAKIAGEGEGMEEYREGGGREAVGGSMQGLWGCSHWPQTGSV